MNRVLGVDLGLKKTGLALSDELRLTVRPLDNLTPASRKEDISKILDICTSQNVQVIVIGYALLPSGDEGLMAKRARNFKDALESEASEQGIEVEVVLLDESMTSKSAERRLIEGGASKKKRRERIDAESACILVEDYLGRC